MIPTTLLRMLALFETPCTLSNCYFVPLSDLIRYHRRYFIEPYVEKTARKPRTLRKPRRKATVKQPKEYWMGIVEDIRLDPDGEVSAGIWL